MSNIFFTNIYLFITATVLAILEIQIEGKHGWAKNLPTWRPHNSNWYAKLYAKIMSGKELTGYHLSMFIFLILTLHLPYVFGLPLTLENWIKTFSLLFIFFVLWDFLWFVLNPHYPLRQFKKEHLAFHHPKWFLGAPTDYWGGIIVSLLVLVPVALATGSSYLYGWWLTNISLFGLQTFFLSLFAIYVLRVDKWHEAERQN